MPITYSIIETERLIVEVWRADVDISTLVAHWQKYLTDQRVLAVRRTLVDLRQAQIKFSAHELEDSINQVVVPLLNGRDWATALLVKNVDQFRASTRYQAFARRYSNDWVFSDVDAATAWLMKQELRAP